MKNDFQEADIAIINQETILGGRLVKGTSRKTPFFKLLRQHFLNKKSPTTCRSNYWRLDY